MKKNISIIALLGGFALLVASGFLFNSCEGPAGPPGVDGSTTCIVCHDDNQVIVTKTRQYNNSAHYLGTTSGYANISYGPTYNCAGCHSSQGFLDNLLGESNLPYADITQPNCYTCHNIHDTYTAEDWDLTHPDLVSPMTGTNGVDLGTGNQCTSCHQFVSYYLDQSELFVNFNDGGLTTVDITEFQSRLGVHHAPQYNILVGIDLFEFTGSATYPTSNHVVDKAADGCVTCHMNDGFGDLTGHSMAMTYSFHGPNYNWPASCLTCHVADGTNDIDDKFESVKSATDLLLSDLYDLLVAANIMYPVEDGSSAYLCFLHLKTIPLFHFKSIPL